MSDVVIVSVMSEGVRIPRCVGEKDVPHWGH